MNSDLKLESIRQTLQTLIEINSEMQASIDLDRPYLEGLKDAYAAVLRMIEVNNE